MSPKRWKNGDTFSINCYTNVILRFTGLINPHHLVSKVITVDVIISDIILLCNMNRFSDSTKYMGQNGQLITIISKVNPWVNISQDFTNAVSGNVGCLIDD